MRVVDANVLLYAVNEDAPHHAAAQRWLDDALAGPEPVAFSWIVLLAFLRLTTHPAVFPRPLDIEQSLAVARHWLEQPGACVIEPTARHIDVLAGLLLTAGSGGNLVNDLHLAALAIEHGAELISYDADFTRVPGLRTATPAAEAD